MELKRDPETGEFKHESFPIAIRLDFQRPRTELVKMEWILCLDMTQTLARVLRPFDPDVTQWPDMR
jgi:hypothetical protein